MNWSCFLTWRLPVALALVALAVWPIHKAYRLLRIGDLDMIDHGAIEESFLSTLLIGIAAAFFPWTGIAVIGVWIALRHKWLLSMRAFLASLIAIAVCAVWYVVIRYAVQYWNIF